VDSGEFGWIPDLGDRWRESGPANMDGHVTDIGGDG
jgi:hypothetical protein